MKPIYKLLVPAAFREHVFEDSKDNVQPGERVLGCWLCFMELQTLQFFDIPSHKAKFKVFHRHGL